MLFASIWLLFLHKLLCCYSSSMLQHWARGMGLNYLWKVDHTRTSRNFQELTWSEYFKWDIVAGYIKNELSMLQEMPSWFFSSKSTYAATRHLHQWQTLGLCTFLQVWSIKGWARLAEFVNNLKSQHFLYLVWHLKLETRKSLLFLCVFRYTFSFTLRLTSTLLQKLAKFYMWNVKQEDDGMNQKSKTPLLLRWIYDFKLVNLNI